jgi:hypothetical protein
VLVPIATLDRWLASSGQPAPHVVKIDVEGGEAGVLRGMRRALTSVRPALIIELHGTGEEVADELDSASYEHHPIEIDSSTREAPWWVHIVATPILASREGISSASAEQQPVASRTTAH